MTELIKDYLAEKALKDFRENKLPAEICKELSCGEYALFFRELVIKSDKDFILERLKSPEDNVRIFAGVILRPIIDLFDLDMLFQYWSNCTNPKEKDYFIYDLLDYKKLPENQHKIIFNYIRNNWDYFVESKQLYLKPELAIFELRKKIKGTNIHPISKKWVYWLNITSYLTNITANELQEFLNEIDTSSVGIVSEEFYIEVKDFLLHKLFINKSKN